MQRRAFSGNEGEERFGYAQGVRMGDLIAVSGQVGRDNPTGQLDSPPTLAGRLERALRNVADVVADLGPGAALVSLQLHVAVPLTPEHRQQLASTVTTFARDERPAVTVVPVATLFSTDYLVEVSAMATTAPRTLVPDDGPLGRDLSRSRAVQVGEQVFLAGHLPVDDASGAVVGDGLIAQFEVVCERLTATLAEVGGTIADIVATHVWIAGAPTDEEVAQLSPAHVAAFGASKPAATLLFVPELPFGARVQISAIAMLASAAVSS